MKVQQWAVGSGQSSVVSRQWSVVSRQSSVVSRQSSVGSRQSAVVSRQSTPNATHRLVTLPLVYLPLVYLSTYLLVYPPPPKTIVPEITKKLHHPVPLCYS